MINQEIAFQAVDRLIENELAIFVYDVPENFAADMEKIFGTNPKEDIVSNIYWAFEFESGWIPGACFALIGSKISKEEAFKKLSETGYKDGLEEMKILYHAENGGLMQTVCERGYDEMYGDGPVWISDGREITEGEFNLCLGDNIVSGIY